MIEWRNIGPQQKCVRVLVNSLIGAILLLGVVSTMKAQTHSPSLELGIQATGTHLHKIDETPLGGGVRVFFNFARSTALDAEVIRYPGKTSALFGMKSGFRLNRFGVFGKGRIGMWHFSRTFFATDIGGVLEYYPSPRTTIRIDLGDTILFYGGAALGIVHNFQPGLGLGFRF